MFEFHLRGETIRTGRLVALESSLEALGDQMTERVRVTLSGTTGLETLLLEDVVSVRCIREKTQSRIDHALSALVSDAQPELTTIAVGFKDANKRTVHIGMMRPVPVWKSSFSLTDDQLVMRVVVDNTSNTDWKDVGLSIADGQPVSFRVNLHRIARLDRKLMPLPIGLPGLPPALAETNLPYPSNLSLVTSAPQDYAGLAFGGMSYGMGKRKCNSYCRNCRQVQSCLSEGLPCRFVDLQTPQALRSVPGDPTRFRYWPMTWLPATCDAEFARTVTPFSNSMMFDRHGVAGTGVVSPAELAE